MADWHKRAKELREQGWTLPQIAEEIGVAWQTVHVALDDLAREKRREAQRRYNDKKRSDWDYREKERERDRQRKAAKRALLKARVDEDLHASEMTGIPEPDERHDHSWGVPYRG